MRPYEHQFDFGPPMEPAREPVPVYPIRNVDDLRIIRRRIEATPQGTAEELRTEWERLRDALRDKLPPAAPSGMEWMGW